MVASPFHTMGIVPGGPGMFEAASVMTLPTAGVDVAVALSATLLSGPQLLVTDGVWILVLSSIVDASPT
jgi:hypothetical protein